MIERRARTAASRQRGKTMTLIIDNKEVEQVLTMEDTMAALEQSYLQLAAQEAVCRPRIDIRIPAIPRPANV
jgi:ornithine cyclodeaminase/alanine dehydrogenase-like protein (mu-crystallin family)